MLLLIGIVVLAPFAFFTFYLMMLSVLARVASRVTPSSARSRKFAVVIPAHNEEGVIAETIRSIQEVDYPGALYDIVVIADNCTDRTAELARALGARVLERNSSDLRGKGYALRWCFDLILRDPSGYEGVAVVDADSNLSKNFLNVVNAYIGSGALAVQTSDMVKPREGAWSSESTRMGFTLYNYVRPLGRKVLGCSAGLRGNGMCFAAETLRRVPWDAYSRAEDLEYGLRLLLNGIKVVFAPEAGVLATMPADARNAETQRARWEGGRLPIVRRYAGPLAIGALSRPSFVLLDALIDLITPPLVNLMGLALFLGVVSTAGWIAGVSGMGLLSLLCYASIAAGLLHVIIGLNAAGADRTLFAALLHIPRYVLWKFMLYAKLVRAGKTKEWVRTTRESTSLPPGGRS